MFFAFCFLFSAHGIPLFFSVHSLLANIFLLFYFTILRVFPTWVKRYYDSSILSTIFLLPILYIIILFHS